MRASACDVVAPLRTCPDSDFICEGLINEASLRRKKDEMKRGGEVKRRG